MSQPTFRFAPSPNGALHLGHAFSALLNQQLARQADARLLLRLEDIDLVRCTPALAKALVGDLAWLGVDWHGPVRRQSAHFADYAEALRRLSRDGLVYPAFLSRGEVRSVIAEAEAAGRPWPRDPDGVPLYPGFDRTLSERERRRRMASGEAFAWRLDCQAAMAGLAGPLSFAEAEDETLSAWRQVAADPAAWGDVVLARKDVPTSYHLAVVVDDALQGVSLVVRGRDLFAATAVQRLLQMHLGLPEPRYFHHRLIVGPDGRKLSKSNRDTGIAALRAAGLTPADVRAKLPL